ncbi:hypothetical protein [Arcobacter sp. s6]|jgi:predicted component of viral defense system (DUF524 family)|uniref:hypothetical protein n=1 Tax=Arcobacter sp. s6 TaxID=3230363 RepID=UPI0034A067A5
MSYLDICIMGWNLNALMFVINFLIAIRVISTQDRSKLQEESLVLKELKDELEKYYPNRTLTTLFSYVIPFTAFFRMTFKLVEMFFFFQRNKDAKMFDYMVYKYSSDISKAKNQ